MISCICQDALEDLNLHGCVGGSFPKLLLVEMDLVETTIVPLLESHLLNEGDQRFRQNMDLFKVDKHETTKAMTIHHLS